MEHTGESNRADLQYFETNQTWSSRKRRNGNNSESKVNDGRNSTSLHRLNVLDELSRLSQPVTQSQLIWKDRRGSALLEEEEEERSTLRLSNGCTPASLQYQNVLDETNRLSLPASQSELIWKSLKEVYPGDCRSSRAANRELITSAKCNSVRKPYANLPDTLVALTSASKYC